MYTPPDHCFAICAYGASPYLDECVQSLRQQTVATRVILVTSTPNPTIERACQQIGCEMLVNDGPGGIAGDWNFAVKMASSPLVTIAHQDDIYLPDYAESMLHMLSSSRNPLLYFTSYGELREGKRVFDNRNLRIKRLMLKALEKPRNATRRSVRRRILSLGCPICCPSVTLITSAFEQPLFAKDFNSNLDWQAWEKLSAADGSFVYNPRPLMLHRIHEGSETSRLIHDNSRSREDLAMFNKFWPSGVATLINHLYELGQSSNDH